MKYVYGLLILCGTFLIYFDKVPYAAMLGLLTLVIQKQVTHTQMMNSSVKSIPTNTSDEITVIPTGDKK